jgi:tRNA(fMet)-specific endonuclease VapC
MSPVPAAGLLSRREAVPRDQLSTTSITIGEIIFGAYRVPLRTAAIIARLNALLPSIIILSFDADAARRYGELRADLERRGTPIGEADTRIASIALTLQLTVITGNVRHFEMVPGLVVENWLP